MQAMTFYIKAEWDDEAGVWFVDSTNVPGLNAEAATRHELLEILDDLVPELLVMNGAFDSDPDLPEIPYSLMFNQLRAQRLAVT